MTIANINELMRELHSLREKMINVSETIAKEFQELSDFMQYFRLIMITNRMRQPGQFLMVLLEYVKAQLDVLLSGHLSSSVVSPSRLKELLLEIQTELPHYLRLPVDPTKELWKYYSILSCVTQ